MPNDSQFWLLDIIPDVKEALTHTPANRHELKDNSIVVLDANILIELYSAKSNSAKEIGAIYKRLAEVGRLKVPSWALREFLKHRQKN